MDDRVKPHAQIPFPQLWAQAEHEGDQEQAAT